MTQNSHLPRHVAIIMDGNGRWAKKRMRNRTQGHEKGANTVRTVTRVSRKLGIEVLTLYAFSTENWQRSKAEVSALMHLLKKFLKSEKQEMLDNNIRLMTIGQTNRLPEDVQTILKDTMAATAHNDGMQLNLALSYGGRDDIVNAARQCAYAVQSGQMTPDQITESIFQGYLSTHEISDPDLLIRTSGEMRVSNFLLWQIAYSEIFITPTLWPDFSENEYLSILEDYQNRERRFGRTD
ncbi:MAG: undecaprenyl diphosphate synthase [Candidatus Magnetoglobus multicellularis str. Araruama]|uniref:Isoprenyl transferase n=1 Tax=Candidatus Magnetoglobus multicellularis str. Araruama TaxID=890399 RepID=A0A1V1P6G9_9BACT|nr:MAG: undecaprenyl diphosphate synthase [Candidatus Magnetoglobus multicellularis str. Araruama]